MKPASDSDVVVTAFARTPFGRFGGGLAALEAPVLAARTIDATLARAGLAPDLLDAFYAGVGMIGGGVLTPARQALLQSSLPRHLPSLTVDRACCSGMTAVGLAWKDLRLGEARAILCGGFESLSNTPFLWPRQRGIRPGAVEVRDPLLLRAEFLDSSIAVYTGEEALRFGIGREEQDAWALGSHQRYFAAEAAGRFAMERLPLAGLESDESPRRDTTAERLAALKTVYGGPTVTPGNAPGLNDGAAFLVLATGGFAQANGLPVLARVLDYVQVADGPTSGSYTPALAIGRVLERQGLAVQDLDLLEINEAFAATPLVSTLKLAGGDLAAARNLRQRTNVSGGAVAIGHPLGASGARLVMTLAAGLAARGGGIGAAAICGGFGQGDALLLCVDG